MKSLFLVLGILSFAALSNPAMADNCAFNFENDPTACGYRGEEGEQSYEQQAPAQELNCSCSETSPSTSQTVWVPNPSGDGGNYETRTIPGTTRSVPCAC